MNIQGITRNIKIANSDGTIHQDFFNLMALIVQQLQANLSNEGYKVPQQTTDKVNELNTGESIGALLYDKDTHEFKVNINGTFKTVQVV